MDRQSRRDVMKFVAASGALAVAGASEAQSQAQGQPATPPAGRVIDANMHWLPETLFSDQQLLAAYMESVPRQHNIVAKVASIPGRQVQQMTIEQPAGYEVLNYVDGEYSPAFRIPAMDAAKVDMAIFRLPCWQEWLDLELCRKANDGMGAHMKRNPGRFQALAVVPPWGSGGALKEIERCIKDLGFCGVQMVAHYGNLYLDEDAFRAHFRFVARLGVPVVVHHTALPVDYASVLKYPNLRRQYGREIAQGTAVGREIFSNLFDEIPDLRVIHSMMGGGFFAFAEMLAPPAGKDSVARFEDESAKIRKRLKENVFFELSGAPQWGRPQLECAVKVFGADHLVYGGSFPIRRDWFQQGVDYVRSLEISEGDKALILGGNASRLFKLT